MEDRMANDTINRGGSAVPPPPPPRPDEHLIGLIEKGAKPPTERK
jgi:hypothetical protein